MLIIKFGHLSWIKWDLIMETQLLLIIMITLEQTVFNIQVISCNMLKRLSAPYLKKICNFQSQRLHSTNLDVITGTSFNSPYLTGKKNAGNHLPPNDTKRNQSIITWCGTLIAFMRKTWHNKIFTFYFV